MRSSVLFQAVWLVAWLVLCGGLWLAVSAPLAGRAVAAEPAPASGTAAGAPAGAPNGTPSGTVPGAPAVATGGPAGGSTAPAAIAPATLDQLRDLVRTLEDEPARGRLVQQLQALIAAQQAVAARPEAAAAEPETLGSRTLSFLAERFDGAVRRGAKFLDAYRDLPRLGDWVQRQADDPSARDRWHRLAVTLVQVLAAAVAALGLATLILRGPRRAIEARPTGTAWAKLPLLVARTVVDLVPVVAFAVAGYAALSAIEPSQRVRLSALAVVNASVIVQMILLVGRAVLSPSAPGLRLVRAGDATAAYCQGWIRRLSVLAVYGYFLTEAAYVLGLPLGAYGAVLKLLGLLLAVALIVLILRNRRAVAEWLARGANPTSEPTAESAADPATDPGAEPLDGGEGAVLRSARRGIADIWHVVAILYVLVTFGVWVLNVYGGFEYLARATLMSLAIVAGARIVTAAVGRAGVRAARAAGRLRETLPDLENRVRHYLPVLQRITEAVVWGAALLAVLNAWGADSLAWTESAFGRRIVGSVVMLGAIVFAAVFAWEVVSALIERFLAETDRFGARVERSARARTLLPLLRNAFLVVLITVVGLLTLSELGVNIAPLLAGAGVVGLAVGFGSQTLVKDVITGLFILFEDTISVGDVVDVGGGHSGVVEAISIRTIRLRDLAGSVHSVPFSAVTTVKNMTKDFSFAVFDVSVDYKEDTDRVIAVLREIGASMQADPEFARDILAPLEVFGLDKMADYAVVIKARFKTRPVKQWSIGREFNRRMKKRFTETGIVIPYPQMQLVMTGSGSDRTLGEALSEGG